MDHPVVVGVEEPAPAPPPPPTLAAMLRRAALRGLIVGAALGVVQVLVVVACVGVLFVLVRTGESTAVHLGAVLGWGLLTAPLWLLVAFPMTPLALVEHWARLKALTPPAQAGFSLLTVPLACLALGVAIAQGSYAWYVLYRGLAPQDALVRVATEFSQAFSKGGPLLVVPLLPLAVPVGMATYARLRDVSHQRQLALTILGSQVCLVMIWAALYALGDLFKSRNLGIAMGSLCGTWIPGLLVSVVLPGAYTRADQLEAWLLRRWASREP